MLPYSYDFLQSVIKATQEGQADSEILYVMSNEELLSIVDQDSDAFEKTPYSYSPDDLSNKGRFLWDIHCELFDDLAGAFYELTTLLNVTHDPSKLIQTEEKIQKLLPVIEKMPPEFFSCVSRHFHMDDVSVIATAAFCLTSIDIDQQENMQLHRVMVRMAQFDSQYLSAVITGLKYGRHPGLTEMISKLVEYFSPNTQLAGLQVLDFRNDLTSDHLQPFLESECDDVRLQASIIQAKHGDTNASQELFNRIHEVSLDDWEAIFTVGLMNHIKEPLRICRSFLYSYQVDEANGQLDCERLARIIHLLSLAGSVNDFQVITQLATHPDPSIQDAAILALGEFGVSSSVPFLIEQLEQAQEDEEKQLFAKILERITGANLAANMLDEFEEPIWEWEDIDGDWETLDEIRFCTDAEQWQSWWNINQERFPVTDSNIPIRWRKGRPLTLKMLLQEIQQPENRYGTRKLAWQELVIRSGHYFYFCPDWPIERQMTQLKQLEDIIELKQKKLAHSIWSFDGKHRIDMGNHYVAT